ncbi:hypothetical protein G9A89_021700 [Geosiphon pyriformis]|nr:hypothetical protein G9A89_021700 [Geosiphon pyriformis]
MGHKRNSQSTDSTANTMAASQPKLLMQIASNIRMKCSITSFRSTRMYTRGLVQVQAPLLQESRIIHCGSKLIDSLQESQDREHVIVPHSVSQNKWLIYLVTIPTGKIDTYVVGDILSYEAEPFHSELLRALSTVFPNTRSSSPDNIYKLLRKKINAGTDDEPEW